MILKVFTGKLRALTALSASTVSVASVSTSSILSSDTRGSAVGVLNSTVNTVVSNAYDLTNTYIVDPAKQVGTSYKGVFDGVKEGATKEKLEEIGEKYKSFGTTAASLVKKYAMPPDAGKEDERLITRDNFEKVNYYVFQYANAAIALINQAKSLILDTAATVVKDQSGKSTAGLISVQKIQQIAKSSEIQTIAGSLLQTYSTFQTHIEGINGKHVHDAIKIIFSTETDNIQSVLQKLQTNIAALNSKTPTDIANTDDLVKRIFVGENAEENIKNGATQAKTAVTGATDILKEIEGVEALLEDLTKVLGNISGDATSPPSEPSESS